MRQLVLTTHGNVPISQIVIGDEVIGKNKKGEKCVNVVTGIDYFNKESKKWIIVNGKYQFASHQSIYLDGFLRHAFQIKKGQKMETVQGDIVVVESIREVLDKKPKINLHINAKKSWLDKVLKKKTSEHAYYLNEILVHNASRFWVGGTGNWLGLSDSYNVIAADGGTNISGYASYASSRGQIFTGNGKVLGSARFYIRKVGSPTGSAYAKIYAITGTPGTSAVPTGAALATSDAFDPSTLSTSYGLSTFTFSGGNKITLTNGTSYAVVIEYTGGGVSDYILVGADQTSPVDDGNGCKFQSGSWSAVTVEAYIFYVYTDGTPWAASSGGSSGASVPTSSDDVYVDLNSGFSGGGTIVYNGLAYDSICHDFVSTSGHSYSLHAANNLRGVRDFAFSGSLVFESGVTMDSYAWIYFYGSTSETITIGGATVYKFDQDGTGTLTLQDNLGLTGEFYIENGIFDANDHNVTAGDFYFYADTGFTPEIVMGSGTWEFSTGGWYLDENSGEVVTITPETSTIKTVIVDTYQMEFYATGKTYHNIWIVGAAGTGYVRFYDSATFNEFRISNAPATIIFTDGETITVSSFIAIGNSVDYITLDTNDETTGVTFSKSSGIVACDYLDIWYNNASGGAAWYAGSNSIDEGGNSGWLFSNGTGLKKVSGVHESLIKKISSKVLSDIKQISGI